MPLETGTYISDLVSTNPVGATDKKNEGDNHLRLIKLCLKNSFPNVDGEVLTSVTSLNAIEGMTGDATFLLVMPGVLSCNGVSATGAILTDVTVSDEHGQIRSWRPKEVFNFSGEAAHSFINIPNQAEQVKFVFSNITLSGNDSFIMTTPETTDYKGVCTKFNRSGSGFSNADWPSAVYLTFSQGPTGDTANGILQVDECRGDRWSVSGQCSGVSPSSSDGGDTHLTNGYMIVSGPPSQYTFATAGAGVFVDGTITMFVYY